MMVFLDALMAGGPTAEQAAKLAKATYIQFLEEPEQSKQIANIPKLLKKFEGNYGTMINCLLYTSDAADE